MDILQDPGAVRGRSRAWKRDGLRVGFVPTMGALHDGHLSLVRAARAAGADEVVASIFVNPTQFGPGEDLAAYPRDPEGDARKLAAAGASLVFLPSVDTIYPPGSQTRVQVDQLSQPLCGISRPFHFGGVATVVTLLFNIVEPDLAVFGEKDFQQLQVIRRLVRDLHLPVTVVGAPIVREPDGLAMSSRNAYLSREERVRATCLHRALGRAHAAVDQGERDAERLRALLRRECEAAGGKVDYAEVVSEDTLQPLMTVTRPARAVLAVRIGRARLLDNRRLL